ncbi:monocarboxylate transporter 12-like [Ylistrum balloti]|uniref:monocarboxylate transporter 12-like n=1 Tax=Ylistrum balloti TaxID=509963 RepID=UPI0029059496|nr:monocarboxylate transporter 12-like [Ylistrum balloti]
MSVLNLKFLHVFGESKAQTALVQAVTTGVLDIAGIIGGAGVNKFGVRKIGMCGGLLVLLGLASSFFATSIPYLIVSIGGVSGFGFSLTFVSCLTSVGEHFNGQAKLVAISIIGVGAGCGSMVFPFLLNYLTEQYGWRGCILIVGGIMGQMVCFFAVCKPKLVGKPQRKLINILEDDKNKTSQLHHLLQDGSGKNGNNANIIGIPRDQNAYTKKLKSLCVNTVFIIFIFGISLVISSCCASSIYMLDFLRTKGFDEHQTLLLYFYMNISTTVGRLIPGLCILVPHIDGLIVSAIFTCLSCVASVGLLEAASYYHHVMLMCLFGLAFGCSNTVLSMTTMELVGVDTYAVGMGILMPVIGVSNICAGAVSGWLVDVTGSYEASYYGMSAVQGVAVCLFITAAVIRRCCPPQDNQATLSQAIGTHQGESDRRPSLLETS